MFSVRRVAFFLVLLHEAQTQSLCSQDTATITAQNDVSAIATCTTNPQQHLPPVCSSWSNNPRFLNFSNLGNVQELSLSNLPSLQSVSLHAGDNALSISGALNVSSTALSTLPQITAFIVTLVNNTSLASATFLAIQAGKIYASSNFYFNSSTNPNTGLNISFPLLTYATQLELQNCSSISLPVLTSVSDGFYLGYSPLTTFLAPQLYSVGNGITIIRNPNLIDLNFPALTSVQGGPDYTGADIADSIAPLWIGSNPALVDITGFDKLENATDEVWLGGDFRSISLPSLLSTGSMEINSTGPLNCSSLIQSIDAQVSMLIPTVTCVAAQGTVTGLATGTGGVLQPPPTTTSPPKPNNSSSTSNPPTTKTSTTLSRNTKIGIGAGVCVPVASLLLYITIFISRKRRQRQRDGDGDTPHSWQAELEPGSRHLGRAEMKGEGNLAVELVAEEAPVEVRGEREIVEVSGAPRSPAEME